MKRWHAIVVIVVSSVLLVLFFSAVYVGTEMQDRDENNFCPVQNDNYSQYFRDLWGIKAGEHSVMLIDTSNAIPWKDGKAAESFVKSWITQLPAFQRISIRDLPKTTNTASQFITGPWCVIWNRGTAPPWLTGRLWADRVFKTKFLPAVQKEFQKAINLSEADESPILETLATLKKDGVNSVFLVSDMMQNTDVENHYKNSLCDENCPDITGLTLSVYYIQREGVDTPANHQQIWEQHLGEEIKWHMRK